MDEKDHAASRYCPNEKTTDDLLDPQNRRWFSRCSLKRVDDNLRGIHHDKFR
ncbi:hypothetical protein [Salinicola acroporae]|uniref:hypothetical protein n=1 Tax=Salinicola acroporae TaxID=1541440 RepID=UPI0013A61CA3|nr:hypothetical protein [Salinicola acroporae]